MKSQKPLEFDHPKIRKLMQKIRELQDKGYTYDHYCVLKIVAKIHKLQGIN